MFRYPPIPPVSDLNRLVEIEYSSHEDYFDYIPRIHIKNGEVVIGVKREQNWIPVYYKIIINISNGTGKIECSHEEGCVYRLFTTLIKFDDQHYGIEIFSELLRFDYYGDDSAVEYLSSTELGMHNIGGRIFQRVRDYNILIEKRFNTTKKAI